MKPIYEDKDYRISALAESGYMVFKLARFEWGEVNLHKSDIIYDSTEDDDIDKLPDKIKEELLKEMI